MIHHSCGFIGFILICVVCFDLFVVGQIISAEIFKDSKNLIDITGITCGKGFSGLQKKYNLSSLVTFFLSDELLK